MAADCTERRHRRFPWAKNTVATAAAAAAAAYWLDVVLSLIKDKVGREPKMVFALPSASEAKPLKGDATSSSMSGTEIYDLNDLNL